MAFILIRSNTSASLGDPYGKERYASLDTFLLSSETMEGFAADRAVIDPKVTVMGAEDFTAQAGVILPASGGKGIFAHDPFERMNPASTTKILTALCALKYGNLGDMIEVTDAAVITEQGASLAGIKPGDKLTLEQLLYGLMLPSGNDAAAAIAVYISGSVEEFCELMNREAMAIGAMDTHFTNPHGLTEEEHYTTPYDLYLITCEALKYDTFRSIIKTKEYQAKYTGASGGDIKKTWKNTNKYILGTVDTPEGLRVLGGKTGTTMAAGSCLVLASSDENGQEYVSVVLKAQNRDELYANMSSLLEKIDR